jgi:MarR family transcriptional regulator for hemolysin
LLPYIDMSTSECQPDLTLLLSKASHVVTTELTAGLERSGITPRGFCVLSHALRSEMTQTRLADMCQLDKTTMVATMDELELAGLATRAPSPSDRRARLITVTPAGARAVKRAQLIVDQIHQDVLSALSDPQRQAFVDGLTTLVSERLASPTPCEKPVRRPRT